MDLAATNGDIFVIDEVLKELERKDDGIHEWIKKRESMVIPIDAEVQRYVSQIMSKFGRLVDSKKNRSIGDPWVIALAQARGLIVVTGEKATGSLSKPKIPDVCKDLGVSCIEIVDFFRKQGWRW
jgi:hypothetical protein